MTILSLLSSYPQPQFTVSRVSRGRNENSSFPFSHFGSVLSVPARSFFRVSQDKRLQLQAPDMELSAIAPPGIRSLAGPAGTAQDAACFRSSQCAVVKLNLAVDQDIVDPFR
jgi:hypothetical protein